MPKIVDHEARRAEVLEATWRVIARLGIEQTTTREIAKEARCSTGVLAHYFRNKDEILRLALDHAHSLVRDRIRVLMDRATGVTVLRAVLGESLPLDEPRQLELTLEVSFWARAVVQTRLRPSQHADYDRWQAIVKTLVEEAKALGEFPAGLDADAAATQLVTFVDGLGVDALLYPERFPPAAVHSLLDRQLRMLGAALPSRRLRRTSRGRELSRPSRTLSS
ncbi:MAG: TetR/AcrR family transcriptional regulator [Acidimicrobiales bacterium]